MVVSGLSGWLPEATVQTPSASEHMRLEDTAALLLAVPGAAVVRNGPLTSIVQLRGLSGDRVKTLVDGMTLTPACPNHMDPPLHYAAPAAVQSLTVMAGITPVSQGGDSLGGTVLVEAPPPRFAVDERPLGFGGASGQFRSSNDGIGVQGEGGVASRTFSVGYQGGWQSADDLRFPGGRVKDTSYELQQHGLTTAFRAPQGVWSVDAGLQQTREAGTPALPMDMIEDDSWRVGLRHRGDYGGTSVDGRVYFHSIDHLMDNFSLRPLGPGAAPMFSPAESDDVGTELAVAIPHERHTWRVGTGFHRNEFEAYQQNALTGAQQDTLAEAARTRVGTWLEWQMDWSETWTTLLGARNDTVLSDAGEVRRAFPAAVPDRNRFNAAEHDLVDVLGDFTAALRYRATEHSTYELAWARKSRAPSLLERYLWTPLSASAGQADGRTYLGNLDLDPEVSHQAAVTADWHGSRWQIKLTPFYNVVSDYIQGTPTARPDPHGRPVLQFHNVDRADLYGADGLVSWALSEQFSVRGTLSYVRGVNQDNDDNLYRIAPLRGTAALVHQWKQWESEAVVEWADAQNEVAAYNGELPTAGYVLLHLRVGYTFRERLRLGLGVENVLDEHYADHLGGINRVGGSDVAVGNRIPGAGRFVHVSASVKF